MFAKSTWMSKGYIAQAIRRLESVKENLYGEYTKAQRDGADEGLACLRNAKPEYLVNLIPQDHPDRIMAVSLLAN